MPVATGEATATLFGSSTTRAHTSARRTFNMPGRGLPTWPAHRMRKQLWRYFPAFLDLEADLSAPWLIELWQAVPTPDKARRIREASIAAILKRNRIRRLAAAQVLEIPRQRPLAVAAGTTEAARAHIVTLVSRLQLINP